MKIAKIEQFFPRKRMRLVKITTDNGIVGWGETTLEGKPKSTWAAVEELAEYFIGKDPLRIEHHWQHVYRSAFFRGGNVLMSALSGIDQALWDIAGKFYDVPAYKLLGGAVRDRIRVYAHWGIRDLSDEGLENRATGWNGCKPRAATKPSSLAPAANGAATNRRPSSTAL
ncbi:MAG: hypothetical protein HC802_14365 [Caldilineaceae bacterium]|nr:hypothetical protein [Caldilineaceae bacterium]